MDTPTCGAALAVVALACAPAASQPQSETVEIAPVGPGSERAGSDDSDTQLPVSDQSRTRARGHCREPLAFDDESLEYAIRRAVGKPEGELRPADVAVLRELESPATSAAFPGAGRPVAELSGIECLPGLKRLALRPTEVSDLSALAALKELEVLLLFGGQYDDLTPLAGLSQLQVLDLSRARVTDLTPLRNLRRLETLHLSGNPLTDLSPLTEISGLRELFLQETRVQDLAPLAGLNRLVYLDLTATQVTNLSPLDGLSRLQVLHVRGTPIECTKQKATVRRLKSRGCLVGSDCP